MEHKSFNTTLITHKPPRITHIAMPVEMLIQGRGGINTCGLGPEKAGSGLRLLRCSALPGLPFLSVCTPQGFRVSKACAPEHVKGSA